MRARIGEIHGFLNQLLCPAVCSVRVGVQYEPTFLHATGKSPLDAIDFCLVAVREWMERDRYAVLARVLTQVSIDSVLKCTFFNADRQALVVIRGLDDAECCLAR